MLASVAVAVGLFFTTSGWIYSLRYPVIRARLSKQIAYKKD